MPDSPDIKVSPSLSSSITSKAHLMTGVAPSGRPHSTSSAISGMNGSHSPLSTVNGRTPSPPSLGSLMNSSSGQQLPPACGARQLSKLKRFLTTLQQFGSDISPEIGERVRSLVLALVNSHISIEEFHGKLQEATNFPLRPFVIPFLKANLPLLQRELLHCARMAKQSPQQYLTQNEHVVFDPANSPLDARDSMMSEFNENGKRCSPDRPKENGLELHIDPHPAKRHHGNHPISPGSTHRVSPGSTFNLSGGSIRLDDMSKSREMRERERERMEREERERVERDRDREKFSGFSFRSSDSMEHLDRIDDDWRHVETMLNCIIGMVDKTKRAMSVLQERSVRDREELTLWTRRQTDGIDADLKKRPGDVMAYTLRQTEDRVSEMRRRAEDAVNDVKRQAMLELQKAVGAADQKASELVAAERSKMERAISEARKQTQAEMLHTIGHQEESKESCWNCGRKASETCSGCNVARYCGSFCQHKDWENHHHVCGKAQFTSAADAREFRRSALAAAAASAVAQSSNTSSLSPSSSSASSSARGTQKELMATSSLNTLSTSTPSTPPTFLGTKSPSYIDNSAVTCISPAPSLSTNEPSLTSAETTIIPTASGVSTSKASSPKLSSPFGSNPATPSTEVESCTPGVDTSTS